MLNRYLELRAAYKVAFDLAYAKRSELQETLNLDLVAAANHPDFKALLDKANGIYDELDALTGHVIRANLEKLSLQDLMVTATLTTDNGTIRVSGIDMLLSDACMFMSGGLIKKLQIDRAKIDYSITVSQDGKKIGYITSDGIFNYEAAPDLRTALGWRAATDGGREHLIEETFDLDRATKSILDMIRNHGVHKHIFFGQYSTIMKLIFVEGHTSRFGGGYIGGKTTLWRVATRELGEEHPGYPFVY